MATFKTSIIADSLWCDWSQWKSHLIKWRCSTKSIQIPLRFTILRKLLQFHQKLVKLCSRSTVKWSQTSSGGGGGVGWCNKRKSFLFLLFRRISNLISSTISIDTLQVKEKRIGICFKSKLSLYVSVSIDLEKKKWKVSVEGEFVDIRLTIDVLWLWHWKCDSIMWTFEWHKDKV